MLKTIPKTLLALVVLITAQACSLQVAATPNPNTIDTAIAETLSALTPTSQVGIPITGGESATPTVVPAVPTSSQAITPAPVFTSTAAVTPTVPQVSVSVATNCRTGPDVGFEMVGQLQAGQAAEVVGRSPNSDYWIIRNPNQPGQTCWLWGQFATVMGNITALPIVVPPITPTPAASFDVSYKGIIENCTNIGWWTEMGLQNTGTLAFKSMTLAVQDRDTNTSRTLFSDGFVNKTGCNESTTQSTLTPGESVTVSSPVFGYDLAGHRSRATITLCSDSKLGGTCITQTVTLKP